MNDLHSEYLKDDHFEEEDEDDVNLEPQKSNPNSTQTSTTKARLRTSSCKTLSWSKCSNLRRGKVSVIRSRFDQ